jgi:hypothetical protein
MVNHEEEIRREIAFYRRMSEQCGGEARDSARQLLHYYERQLASWLEATRMPAAGPICARCNNPFSHPEPDEVWCDSCVKEARAEQRQARLDAAWTRIKAGGGFEFTGRCEQCGALCWDHLPLCDACDQKTVGAVLRLTGSHVTVDDDSERMEALTLAFGWLGVLPGQATPAQHQQAEAIAARLCFGRSLASKLQQEEYL